MTKKRNWLMTIDVKLHAQVDVLRALRWLLPAIAVALKLAAGDHAGAVPWGIGGV